MGLITDSREGDKEYLTSIIAAIYKNFAAATDVRLFNNNFVPGRGSVFGDFVEPSFTGYTPFVVTSWASGIDPVSDESYVYPGLAPVSFTITSLPGDTIYGVFGTDGSSHLLFFERFDTPVILSAVSQQIIVFPKLYVINAISGPDAYED